MKRDKDRLSITHNIGAWLKYCKNDKSETAIQKIYMNVQTRQWMIAQMVERLLCTRLTRVQIPTPAPYEIICKCNPY